jgi:hypothetical protein
MELVSNGMTLLMTQRRRVQPIGAVPQGQPDAYRQRGLAPSQVRWLEATHKGIARNRVERVK